MILKDVETLVAVLAQVTESSADRALMIDMVVLFHMESHVGTEGGCKDMAV